MDKLFGFRVGYILVAYFVLKVTLTESNIPTIVTFGALVLYLLPFVFDYANMVPASKQGKVIKEVGLWISAFALFIAGASMFHAVYSSDSQDVVEKTIYILTIPLPVMAVWAGCGVWLLLGVVDWVVFSTKEEMNFREELRKRERVNHGRGSIPFDDRVNHYKERSAEN